MNRRQKKKYWKNHVILMNTRTGKRSIFTMKEYEKLLELAEIMKEKEKEE